MMSKVDDEDDIDFAVDTKDENPAEDFDAENDAVQGMIQCLIKR